MSVLRKIKRAWFGLRDWRDRHGVTSETAGAGQITWNPRHLIYVRAYYRYCVALFREELRRTQAPLHLLFGDYPNPAGGPVRRIDFQIEHTLVKPDAQDSIGAPTSRTPLPDGSGHYLARLLHRAHFESCDLVVDYSAANLAHLKAAGGFDVYLGKAILISPLLFAPDFSLGKRDRAPITLFSDAQRGRRKQFLDAAERRGLGIRNVKRSFDADHLQRVYRRSRILVNVHQTEHHDTLEELRILPALLCGVLVISEDVPLKAHIPYARFVIWARYDELPETIAKVEAEYAVWHARIFSDPELAVILERMRVANCTTVAAALSAWHSPQQRDTRP